MTTRRLLLLLRLVLSAALLTSLFAGTAQALTPQQARALVAGETEARTAARAAMLLGSADPAKRLEAAKSLGATGTPATKTLLLDRQKVETDAAVKAAIAGSLDQIEGRLAWGERFGVIFTGMSLGSIL